HQTDASCTATAVGDSSGGWYQDDQDDGDWRADSSGTGSTGTGPGSTDTSTGVGVGKDFNPGTTAGTYLYTEGTGATCTNTTINLLSPCFDFSGSSYYQLSFAYHMHGSAMGSLSVDVHDGRKWINDVWTIKGDQGENWHIAKVGLANYSGSAVELRIRAVMGVNFLSDCAIDDMNIATYSPDDYDGEIFSANVYTEEGYFFMPDGHIDSIYADITIRNNGIKAITGVSIVSTVPSGSDTFYVGTIAPGDRDTLIKYVSHLPSKIDTTVRIELILNETDANTSNNVFTGKIGPNESIYSRDDGTIAGGVGAGAAIEIGNIYTLHRDDTLTSATFFINGGPTGDSVRVNLYGTTGGTPSNLIVRSDFVVLSGQPEWYTIALGSPGCDQELKKGDYFLAVQQVNTVNMGLGYGTNLYKPNKSMYNTGGGWTDLVLSGIGLNALVRMNFGEVVNPEISLSIKDTLCKEVEYVAVASGASNFVWEPFGIVQSKTGKSVKIKASATFNLKVTGTDQCGKTGVLSKTITVIKTPDLSINNDTTVCEFASVLLKATTKSNYHWIGGPSNTSYGVNPGTTSTYTAEADSFFGCMSSRNVTVTVSKPTPGVTPDTTICQAQPLQLIATGGSTYQWTGGPNTAMYNVNPNTDTKYIVRVTDTYNCSAFDTVDVKTVAGPPLFTSADTSICFGNRVLIKAFGADSYEWIGGPNTAEYTPLPLSTKNFYVRGYSPNGCYLTDSVKVFVAKIPKVSLRPDTTICEDSDLDIVANTSDDVDFAWRSGPTTQKITVSPKTTTDYKVVVTNSTGCFAEDSVRITVDPLPVLDFSMTQNVKNISILNNSLHGETHSWNFGDGDSSKEKSVTHKYRVHGDYILKYTITNKCGSRDTSYTVVVENLAVNDVIKGGITVYPNPTSGSIVVGFKDFISGPVLMELHSVEGDIVKAWTFSENEFSNEQHIDIEAVTSGTYLLQIYTTDGMITHRIIKL
ncbi:MAG: hypothetical protein ACI8SE_000308, partial [Bacteroidia bacterium]